ncbi:MAG: histidine phosphatase family protein [Rhodospirillales bacterium]|nr:histidine phosphatase family protein [Rhodospirillales bacterium]
MKLKSLQLALLLLFLPAIAWGQERDPLVLLAEAKAVLILRHAQTVPGTGDPAGFDPGDCSTQRNLSDAGRQEAQRLGAMLRDAGLGRARLFSSPWCRAQETARLLALGPVEISPLLASIWNDRLQYPDRSAELRQAIADWSEPEPLILVTHGVNISALLGKSAAQGSGYILVPEAKGTVAAVGRVP